LEKKSSVLILWPLQSSLQAQKNSAYLAGVFAFLAAIYTIVSRHTFKEFLHDTAPIAAILTVVAAGWAIQTTRADRARWPELRTRPIWEEIPANVLATLIFVSALSVGFYVFKVSVSAIFVWARSIIDQPSFGPIRVRIVVAVSSLFIGGACYFVRSRLRACYGLTEILVGILVALSKTSENSHPGSNTLDVTQVNSTFAIAILTASVYLIVRGLDNLVEGSREEREDKKDPVVTAATNWLAAHRFLDHPSDSPPAASDRPTP
jgi:hypothetical protein